MNDSPVVHIYDPNFQSQHAAKCDLLVKATSTRVSYAVVDQLQDQLKAVYDAPAEHPEEHLQQLAEQDPFLKFHFRKVKAATETRDFSFIPSVAYTEELLPAYSAFFSGHDEVHAGTLRSAGIKNVTSLGKTFRDTARHLFSNPLFYSQADPVIESFLKSYSRPMTQQLLLQLNGTTFEALLTNGRKVIFYNLFDNSTADEFNYFLLLLISQTGLVAQDTPVMLSGDIAADDERYQRVARYFNTISFADSTVLMRIPDIFAEIPAHRYFSLLGLNACE